MCVCTPQQRSVRLRQTRELNIRGVDAIGTSAGPTGCANKVAGWVFVHTFVPSDKFPMKICILNGSRVMSSGERLEEGA